MYSCKYDIITKTDEKHPLVISQMQDRKKKTDIEIKVELPDGSYGMLYLSRTQLRNVSHIKISVKD